ncbi:FHA domain-containing protein [Pendulispora rubella]|uniref:FHA domain-containing protein n=1 Tax=Pendulispora rubella TaxID=2741070 RepID=A0ABZ2LFL3_9BACT
MPCPKCGQPTQPSDKFCNSCGFSLASAGAGAGGLPPPPPASPFGAPPPPPASPFGGPPPPAASPFGGPPPPPPPFEGGGGSPYGPPPGAVPGAAPGGSRCAQGHDIAPGQSYCREGHPLALDAMNFGSDMYGAPAAPPPAPGYGQPPPFGAPPAYGAPPQSPFVGSPFGGAPHPGAPGMPPGIQPPQAYGGGLPPAPPPFGDIPPSPPLAGPAPFGGGPPQPFGAPLAPPGPPGGFGPPVGYGQPPQAPQYGLQAPAARAPLMGGGPTNMLRGFLISFQSNPQGEFWPLFGGRLQVGRANTGELDIPLADATISSRHASLVIDGPSGTIFVEDTGSTNGTYVNDENIGPNGRRELRDGDRLRFGGYTTLVKVIGPLQ